MTCYTGGLSLGKTPGIICASLRVNLIHFAVYPGTEGRKTPQTSLPPPQFLVAVAPASPPAGPGSALKFFAHFLLRKCDAGGAGGLGHGGGHGVLHPGIKGGGDDVVGGEVVAHQLCQSLGGGQLHGVVDVAGPGVQRPPEDAGEGQHIVDLVGVVAAAGGDHCRAAGLGLVGEDLRGGIGAGKNDGIVIHGLHHLCGQGAGGGDADEDVRAGQNLCQGAGPAGEVGHLGQLLLDGIHPHAPALVDGAVSVTEGQIPDAGGEQEPGDGHRCRACAVDDDPDGVHLFAHDLQCVGQACQGDDGGAVLVVVEDGDVAEFF